MNNEILCTICNVKMTGEEPYRMHLKGRKHLRKAEIAANNKVQGISTIVLAEAQPVIPNQYFCKVCNIPTTGAIPYQQHVDSAGHQRKASLMKILAQPQYEVLVKSTNEPNSSPSSVVSNDQQVYINKHLKGVLIIGREESIQRALERIGF